MWAHERVLSRLHRYRSIGIIFLCLRANGDHAKLTGQTRGGGVFIISVSPPTALYRRTSLPPPPPPPSNQPPHEALSNHLRPTTQSVCTLFYYYNTKNNTLSAAYCCRRVCYTHYNIIIIAVIHIYYIYIAFCTSERGCGPRSPETETSTAAVLVYI